MQETFKGATCPPARRSAGTIAVPVTLTDDSPTVLMDRPARALCPLAMQVRESREGLVGRPIEMTAIRQELTTAQVDGWPASAVEGEPGIGKTRLLMAAEELAEDEGFVPLAIAADEELRGPFLLARSIIGCRPVQELAAGRSADAAVRRALDALTGRDDPALAGLPPVQKLLRTYDLAAIAIDELAAIGRSPSSSTICNGPTRTASASSATWCAAMP